MNFDEYQQRVIDSNDKDILVSAGAGSGKTTTLLHRIKRLMQDGVDPNNVLVLTFTRAAALEMKERFSHIVEDEHAPEFTTFHGFCYRLMSENSDVLNALGYVSMPSIADEDTARYLHERAKRESGCKLTDKAISNPESLAEKYRLSYDAYAKFLNRLYRKENLISFDKLNESVCNLFTENSSSVEAVKKRYEYVFVDEFQDTDECQFRFVMSMKDSKRLLCGDALQNIYQFRGCTNEPFKTLMGSEEWTKLELPYDYRSTEQICEYVNDLSRDFVAKDYRIELVSKAGSGIPVEETYSFYPYENVLPFDRQFVSFLSATIMEQEGSTAILCRTNRQVDYLKDQIVFACSLESIDQDINIVKSLISEEYLASYLESLIPEENYDRHLAEKVHDVDSILDFPCPEYQAAIDQINMINKIISQSQRTSDLLVSLSQLFSVNLDVDREFTSTQEVLEHLLDRLENDKTYTVVCTMHASKGLEFDNVIVLQSFELDTEPMQNLFYVACTRAKKTLIISRDANL